MENKEIKNKKRILPGFIVGFVTTFGIIIACILVKNYFTFEISGEAVIFTSLFIGIILGVGTSEFINEKKE